MAIAWAIEEEDAVVTALAAWLASPSAGLGAVAGTGQPAITVLDDWPDATGELALPSVAITRASEAAVDELDPALVTDDVTGAPMAVPAAGNTSTFLWRVAQASLPLQIDVWASSKPMRGDALARLRVALTASKALTLASYLAARSAARVAAGLPPMPAQDPVENSIVCQLAGAWSHVLCDYAFRHRPSIDESPTGARADEWRATLRGEATFDLTVRADSPRLARIAFGRFSTL